MAKLTKPVFGVLRGEIYPREVSAGEDCPPELEDFAREIGALTANKAHKRAPETK